MIIRERCLICRLGCRSQLMTSSTTSQAVIEGLAFFADKYVADRRLVELCQSLQTWVGEVEARFAAQSPSAVTTGAQAGQA